jgi:hypothetical protein
VLATEIDSRLLCPGTPSKVFACASFNACLALCSSAALALACASVMIGFGRGFGGGAPLMRSAAARVIRGGIVGAAVDATEMDSLRLCPGTSANILCMASLDGVVRGEWLRSILGGVTPARRSAARVVRGTMLGNTWVKGISRALKEVRREEVRLVLREELPPGEWLAPFVLVLVLALRENGWLEEERMEDETEMEAD